MMKTLLFSVFSEGRRGGKVLDNAGLFVGLARVDVEDPRWDPEAWRLNASFALAMFGSLRAYA